MMIEDDEPEAVDEGLPAWMATFSDLATLLLTFFVLLLSFANMDVKNFRTAMGSVKEAMGVQMETPGDYEALSSTPVVLSETIGSDEIALADLKRKKDETAEKMKKMIRERGLEGSVEVVGTTRGVVVRTKDHVLFERGSDEIRAEGRETLELVADLFAAFSGNLEVQGHTDNIPIRGSRFASNWELSAARASAVLRHLIEVHGAERSRLHVAGYADTRPVASMVTEAGRAKNRRVELLFEYPDESPDETPSFDPPSQ